MAGQIASFVFLAFLAGTAIASRPLVIQEEGSASDTAQNVVSRSTLTLPDSANKEAVAQAFINGLGSNGVIEKRKDANGFSTLSASYDLAEAMLIDALSGAPLSTAGRLQFTADADNNINVELTLFYPDGLSDEEIEGDAVAGINRVDQQRAAGAYDDALRNAGQEAGFDGEAVVMSDFDVVQTNGTTNGASGLKAGLWGLCVSIAAILLLA
ncbi:hypothetical protein DUNSADRAFT_4052 [Dunaliella salina]|nr:hypothetical protein DUNSADRAFT_4052 [Dunaliella salina]|eukprot:KAF5837687.1 hypothetical protein DUNSADRAFT_4052 [Dunaliella salina]